MGQVVMVPAEPSAERVYERRTSYRLSDPELSELPLEELLDELLVRVQEALEVDTVAILLHDARARQLVARAGSRRSASRSSSPMWTTPTSSIRFCVRRGSRRCWEYR
jgi:hypothetical protein